jgi:hypothetical protein
VNAIGLAIIWMLTSAPAAAAKPKFEDFAVREPRPSGLAAPDLASHADARRFRTALRRAARRGVTFAGHFTIVEIGCGTSCVSLGIIDRVSGRVFFPSEFIAMSFVGLDERPGFQYRKDSRLIVGCGDPGEKDCPACRYYEWTGTSAKLIATLPARLEGPN